MSKRGTYVIRISGVEDGDHDHWFELDRAFFSLFEHPEIEKGEVRARVTLEKKPGLLALHFALKGQAEVVCDRCLEPVLTDVAASHVIYLKRGETPGELEDDVVMIGEEDHEIEVAQYLYEYTVLALPYQRIHPADKDGNSTCDPGMLEQLNAHRPGKKREREPDPRWDALKGILKNNN